MPERTPSRSTSPAAMGPPRRSRPSGGSSPAEGRFVTPQPQKRPRSSFVRFEAFQPNERWQADMTHWPLAGGEDTEICNMLDDHSRLLVASEATAVAFKAADVVATFRTSAAAHGFPASLLTDNAAVFTAGPRGADCVPSSSSAPPSASRFDTPLPTTPRPAARWSGSTR